MASSETQMKQGFLPMLGRFFLQAIRWLAAVYFILLGLMPLRAWLRLKAGNDPVDVYVSEWHLHLASQHGSTSFSGWLPAYVLLFGVIVAVLSRVLRFVSRRELSLHSGILLGLTILVVAASWDWRAPTSTHLGQQMPALDVTYFSECPDMRGKVVLVEFWATWCGPCIANIPHLNALQAKFADRGLVVVGISSEKQPAVVERFWRKGEMHYAVATQGSGALQNELGVRGIPHSFLVDRTGRIIWDGHPSHLTAERIEAALR